MNIGKAVCYKIQKEHMQKLIGVTGEDTNYQNKMYIKDRTKWLLKRINFLKTQQRKTDDDLKNEDHTKQDIAEQHEKMKNFEMQNMKGMLHQKNCKLEIDHAIEVIDQTFAENYQQHYQFNPINPNKEVMSHVNFILPRKKEDFKGVIKSKET